MTFGRTRIYWGKTSDAKSGIYRGRHSRELCIAGVYVGFLRG